MSELIILSAQEISEINRKFDGGDRKGGIEFILSRIKSLKSRIGETRV